MEQAKVGLISHSFLQYGTLITDYWQLNRGWLRLLKGSSTVVVLFFLCFALFSIVLPYSVSETESA